MNKEQIKRLILEVEDEQDPDMKPLNSYELRRKVEGVILSVLTVVMIVLGFVWFVSIEARFEENRKQHEVYNEMKDAPCATVELTLGESSM